MKHNDHPPQAGEPPLSRRDVLLTGLAAGATLTRVLERPVLAEEVDSLVLGCTHYPLLKPLLRDVAGPGVRLIDSALTTAELAARRLHEAALLNDGSTPADYRYVVTDVPLRFQTIGERFLGRSLGRVERVDW